ncbi:PEST proteolytic signal-containing nuclear protein-like [Macrosteles quadrilineatus]|uniref:PEST proteolytic signal-containing nuclear protein-like n=1 Tax=Macrosteles quadrilineatus TaxID=74068 RepID=UPI0023E170D7|nr:PEST proteolytic signal-containing nuclear protein-like [Macrosteles quadrilineatus]
MSSKRNHDEGSSESEKKTDSDQKEDQSKRQKMTFGFTKTAPKLGKGININKPVKAINMKLENQNKITPLNKPLKNVFNDESDEEEEMPPEAKMRMRNIGRETPTSAGPNSFGKTKQGFCDAKKVFEKNLKKAALEAASEEEESRRKT